MKESRRASRVATFTVRPQASGIRLQAHHFRFPILRTLAEALRSEVSAAIRAAHFRGVAYADRIECKSVARRMHASKCMQARKKWSQKVTENSHSLALERGVFRERSPRRIAQSLKRSAERSRARKGTPLQSAMSMLNFYINRAGKNISAGRKRTLEKAKTELRGLFQARARRRR